MGGPASKQWRPPPAAQAVTTTTTTSLAACMALRLRPRRRGLAGCTAALALCLAGAASRMAPWPLAPTPRATTAATSRHGWKTASSAWRPTRRQAATMRWAGRQQRRRTGRSGRCASPVTAVGAVRGLMRPAQSSPARACPGRMSCRSRCWASWPAGMVLPPTGGLRRHARLLRTSTQARRMLRWRRSPLGLEGWCRHGPTMAAVAAVRQILHTSQH